MSVHPDIIDYVTRIMGAYDPSHDMNHIWRVKDMAMHIAQEEGITSQESLLLIELGALLHDVCDSKYTNGDTTEMQALLRQHYDEDIVQSVLSIVSNVSYSKEISTIDSDNPRYMTISNTLTYVPISGEQVTPAHIVQDADRLDALGAIGIARCLYFGASKRNPIIGTAKSAAQHFDDKLFKLPALMKTATGRKLAMKRVAIMHLFISQLESECNTLN